MRHVIVRYKLKPDRVAEHEALIRAVFAELAETKPAGIRYAAFKAPGGVSSVHTAHISADTNPLDANVAFRAFGAKIRERCETPPQVTELGAIGSYGL